MAALPYIQLYVADYLADTIHLTTEEHGAYMLLIFNYWQTGKPLPANRLASIVKLPNDRWLFVEQTLSEFFTLDDDGHWYHERIEMDLNKVKSKSTQASMAGKASAAKRAATKAVDYKGDSNGRSNAVERGSNHTEADTDIEADTESKNLFVFFWGNYPKKSDKKKAMAAFNRLPKAKKQLAIIDCKTRYSGTDKKYIPLATTYINGYRWDDEKEAAKPADKHSGFQEKDYQSDAVIPDWATQEN